MHFCATQLVVYDLAITGECQGKYCWKLLITWQILFIVVRDFVENSGKFVPKKKTNIPKSIVVRVTDDGFRRLPIANDLAERIPWLQTPGPLVAWLIVLGEGRYRLLSDGQVQANEALNVLRDYIMNGILSEDPEPTFAGNPNDVALPARLLPTEIEFKKAWRVSLPKSVYLYLPTDANDRDFTIVLVPGHYLDIWSTHTFRRAVFAPFPPNED
jgi:hypothetical protein